MSNANSKAVWGVVLVTACLISGNLVGAGILGAYKYGVGWDDTITYCDDCGWGDDVSYSYYSW